MKQPKRITRKNKEVLTSHGLNPNDWMILTESEFYLTLVSKENKNKRRTIDKFIRRK